MKQKWARGAILTYDFMEKKELILLYLAPVHYDFLISSELKYKKVFGKLEHKFELFETFGMEYKRII
jgi:hypothetical protein